MKLSIIAHPNFGCVRTQMIKGEPWFIVKDVCKVLELENNSQAISRLENDEKGGISMDTLGGKQTFAAVNESGLYNLIFQSRKQAARRFRKWVTSEVLPSLRKYGKYVIAGSEAERREQIKLDKRERMEMLSEVSLHLTSTDLRVIGKKLFIDDWKVREVLSISKFNK